MTPNDNNTGNGVRVRLQASPFCALQNTCALRQRGWRCYVRHHDTDPRAPYIWIIKRGATAVMLFQTWSETQVQTVDIPTATEARELCELFEATGIAVLVP